MNTDEQKFSSNLAASYSQASVFYMPNNGMEQQYLLQVRSQAPYPPLMNLQPYMNQQMPYDYSQPFYVPSTFRQNFLMPTYNLQPMNPSAIPIMRSSNDKMNYSYFMLQNENPTNPPENTNPPSTSTVYTQLFFPTAYSMPTSHQASQVPPLMPNQSQSPWTISGSQQSTQIPPTVQHSQIDQQLTLYPSTVASGHNEKQKNTPFVVIDPVSHKPVEIFAQSTTSTVLATTKSSVSTITTVKHSSNESTNTDSVVLDTKSTSDTNNIQKEVYSPRTYADMLVESSRTRKDESDNRIPEVNKRINATSLTSQVTPSQSTTTTTTPIAIINDDKPQATPKQPLRYNRQELLRIRDIFAPLPMPQNLPNLSVVICRCDDNHARYSYADKNSQRHINSSCPRQLSPSNHRSLIHDQTTQNSTSDSSSKTEIRSSTEPSFSYRIENPRRPVDQNKIDTDNKFLHDVRSILNELTSQTYKKLQKKIAALEINCYERLEGLVMILHSKAVNEPQYGFLYAKLCQQFQNTHVNVIDKHGRSKTHQFRQILLIFCQKEFKSDYRQEIEYEKRKLEVEAIKDEKIYREETEKLEEDLIKTKQRKLGNILFIGELFKLTTVTNAMIFDYIEYLLRDKTDEENLESLCQLLRSIGKEIDTRTSQSPTKKYNLEKYYRELDIIAKKQKISARIRFMIQEVIELRQTVSTARPAETKSTVINEIDEQMCERQQCRDQNHSTVISSVQDSHGSGIKQQSSIDQEDRVENRFHVDTLRQLQFNDKQNQEPFTINLAPERTWTNGSGIDKKLEEDHSLAGRSDRPLSGPIQQLKMEIDSSQSSAPYPIHGQLSNELASENSQHDHENASQLVLKTTTDSEINSSINITGTSLMINSREVSHNISCEQSCNSSNGSDVSESISTTSLSTLLDEEKIEARIYSLIDKYTENDSDLTDRSVKEALKDLAAFYIPNLDQQAIIVRELFKNVLEAKPCASKAVGHLLDAALNDNVLSTEAFISGFKMIVKAAPDYAADIPLIWQYIGGIIGAFIGASTSNITLLKPILECVPDHQSKQLFQFIILYAKEFSSQTRIQNFWQSSGFSLNDLLKPDMIDSSFLNEYYWLFDTPHIEQSAQQAKESHSSRTDPQLVQLFTSVNDQSRTATDAEIITYIREHMDPNGKSYIRNIVLSYLEACLINRDPQKKIQEDIAKKRMTILNAIIEHKPEREIQTIYAIQNFVTKLEHPPKMAQLLFDLFYDEECVSKDAFFEWLKHPDQSETEGHAIVVMSTKDFFSWLQHAETKVEEEEEGN
ncbi:unnamed protein product [Rotaria sp. Silwood1]|nr:unnamed protein product [Rotaria sp. Silwood1]CAF1559054.1 unnamed protein product [Rotaria sp. Silwood1]CAF4810678.1 unnamed protein product [Rotaria sp. Silwood1]